MLVQLWPNFVGTLFIRAIKSAAVGLVENIN
jgi:hypothetical protein